MRDSGKKNKEYPREYVLGCQRKGIMKVLNLYSGIGGNRKLWQDVYEALYPDMSLYQEIILLKHFAPIKTKWVIENVKPYYDLLIDGIERDRHIFWSNFFIGEKYGNNERKHNDIIGSQPVYGFDINGYKVDNKRQIMRNLVNPYLGLHIFNESKRDIQPELFRKDDPQTRTL